MSKIEAAVIVSRVSAGAQAKDGTSLEAQLQACRVKAVKLGLPVVREYEDAGISGELRWTRSGIQSAIADIKSGRTNTLVTFNMDRYSRDLGISLAIKKEVEEAGGQLVFCDVEFEKTPEGDFMFAVYAAVAQLDKKKIRARTLGGKITRIEQGIQTAPGMRPWGYQIVKKSDILEGAQPIELLGRYLVVEEEAKWAAECFTRYANGASLMKLARWLQDNGILPTRGGKVWHPNTLSGILRNPVYKGLGTSGKRRRVVDEARIANGFKRADYSVRLPESEWRYIPAPAIVDEKTWDLCQERLRDNQARLSGNNKRRHVLTGLLKCPVCDRNMRSKKCGGANRRNYVHFHCRDYSARGNLRGIVCNPKFYNATQIEEMTAKAFAKLIQEPELFQAAMSAFQRRHLPEDQEAKRRQAEDALSVLKKEVKAIAVAQVKGTIAGTDTAVYEEMLAESAAKKQSLEARLDALAPAESVKVWEPKEIEAEVVRRISRLEEVLRSHELDADKKHELLAMVVEALVPEGDGLQVILKAPPLLSGQTVRRIVVRAWAGWCGHGCLFLAGSSL